MPSTITLPARPSLLQQIHALASQQANDRNQRFDALIPRYRSSMEEQYNILKAVITAGKAAHFTTSEARALVGYPAKGAKATACSAACQRLGDRDAIARVGTAVSSTCHQAIWKITPAGFLLVERWEAYLEWVAAGRPEQE